MKQSIFLEASVRYAIYPQHGKSLQKLVQEFVANPYSIKNKNALNAITLKTIETETPIYQGLRSLLQSIVINEQFFNPY